MPQLQLAYIIEIVQILPVLQDQLSLLNGSSRWKHFWSWIWNSGKNRFNLRRSADILALCRMPTVTLGLCDPHLSIIENPQWVTPTKLLGKNGCEMDLALDPKALEIHSELMPLGPDQMWILLGIIWKSFLAMNKGMSCTSRYSHRFRLLSETLECTRPSMGTCKGARKIQASLKTTKRTKLLWQTGVYCLLWNRVR